MLQSLILASSHCNCADEATKGGDGESRTAASVVAEPSASGAVAMVTPGIKEALCTIGPATRLH